MRVLIRWKVDIYDERNCTKRGHRGIQSASEKCLWEVLYLLFITISILQILINWILYKYKFKHNNVLILIKIVIILESIHVHNISRIMVIV